MLRFNKKISKAHLLIKNLGYAAATLSPFNALSPLDGRYANQTEDLAKYFSESALMRYRIKVESEWMLHLLRNKVIPENEDCSYEQI